MRFNLVFLFLMLLVWSGCKKDDEISSKKASTSDSTLYAYPVIEISNAKSSTNSNFFLFDGNPGKGNAMTVLQDGNLLLGGAFDEKSFLVKFSRDGQIIWRKENVLVDSHVVEGVTQHPNGDIYLCGTRINKRIDNRNLKENTSDVLLAKVTDMGDVLWTKVYDREFQEEAYFINVTGEDNLILGGSTKWNSFYSQNYFLNVYPSGDTVWSRASDWEYSWHLLNSQTQLSSGNGFVITYNSVVFTEHEVRYNNMNERSSNVVLRKKSMRGDKLWEATLPNSHHSYSVETHNGQFLTCGSYNGYIEPLLLTKTDAEGTNLWNRILTVPEPSAILACPTDTGEVYTIVGRSFGCYSECYYVLQIDGEGRPIWYRRFQEIPDTSPVGLLLGPNDEIFIYGYANWGRTFVARIGVDGTLE